MTGVQTCALPISSKAVLDHIALLKQQLDESKQLSVELNGKVMLLSYGVLALAVVSILLLLWARFSVKRDLRHMSVGLEEDFSSIGTTLTHVSQKQTDLNARLNTISADVAQLGTSFIGLRREIDRALVKEPAAGAAAYDATPILRQPIRREPLVPTPRTFFDEVTHLYNQAGRANDPGLFENHYPGEFFGITNAETLVRSRNVTAEFATTSGGDFYEFPGEDGRHLVVPRLGRQFLQDRRPIWVHVFECPEDRGDSGRAIRLIAPAIFENRSGRWSLVQRGRIETE